MSTTSLLLDNQDWEQLIRGIKEGRCTPFLGAGISYGLLPLGAQIAQQWAQAYNYPMADSYNLIRVSQFLAVEEYPMFPKDELVRMFKESTVVPNLGEANQPHRVLAELPLTTYITTNYDNFMAQALVSRFRDAKEEICRWNSQVRSRPSLFDEGYRPSPANPVVFHLHGRIQEPYSLVLTEDDYFDFLVNVSQDTSIIPQQIQKSLTQTSLLFIGYGLADWNFRVLLQSLSRFMEQGLRRHHLAVMLPPEAQEGQAERSLEYWSKYYQRININVCWATASDFLTELRRRWNDSQ
ncbi:MAG TPA: SIR2 family protein [Pyrinomonadaceae bacterium]|jgi:hypothetical protein|nr:SIR2 family protein [Pyrinomonadaceae bacterium]